MNVTSHFLIFFCQVHRSFLTTSTRHALSPPRFEVLKIPLPQKELGDQRLTIALIFTSKIFLI